MLGKIALVMVLALSLEECSDRGSTREPAGPGPQFNKAQIASMCNINTFGTIRVHLPHESKGSPGWMTGKAWLTCTQTIERAHMEVKIQRKGSKGWIDHSRPKHCNGPVGPGAKGKMVCQTPNDIRCPKGYPDTLFRTAARAEGWHEGSYAGMMQWEYSGETKVPCQ